MDPFGAPEDWRADDLVGVSDGFDEGLVLTAYGRGLFPMPLGGGLIGWYSPLRRGVLPLDGLRVSRSLRKVLGRYRVTVDTAFDAVLAGCADPRRPHGWIDGDVRQTYRSLHAAGIVHSVEAWTPDGELAGGLYGVGLGGLFAGESMFHRADVGRDASKVALVALVDLLRGAPGGVEGRLLDVQWATSHLASLGVVEVPREEYLRRVQIARALPEPVWSLPS